MSDWQPGVRRLLGGAAGPVAHRIVVDLLGCSWGRRIGLPGNDTPCLDPAEKITILHLPQGGELEVRLCAAHHELMESLTDAHNGP